MRRVRNETRRFQWGLADTVFLIVVLIVLSVTYLLRP